MMTATNMRRLAAVLLLGGVLAAGCGGGGDDGSDGVASIDENAAADASSDDEGSGDSGGGPVDEGEMQDAMLEYTECMRDHGIDMPDPEFQEGGGVSIGFEPGSGIDPESEEFKAAEEECQSILEEVRPDVQLSPEEQAEMQDRLVAMAECMRARGHDMPDPQVADDGGVRITRGPAGGGDEAAGEGPPDEEFEQDMEECSEEAGMDGGPGFNTRSSEDEG
jgi:hypothetical protein